MELDREKSSKNYILGRTWWRRLLPGPRSRISTCVTSAERSTRCRAFFPRPPGIFLDFHHLTFSQFNRVIKDESSTCIICILLSDFCVAGGLLPSGLCHPTGPRPATPIPTMDGVAGQGSRKGPFHRIRVRQFPYVSSGSRFRSFICMIKGTYGTNLAKNDQLLFA
jgi:hypothetical protein